MLKIKTVIIILKILANFIVHRNFDNLIYNFVQKDDTQCRTIAEIWKNKEKDQESGTWFNISYELPDSQCCSKVSFIQFA